MYNILPNSVTYFDKVFDPLFPATGDYVGSMDDESNTTLYLGDKFVTTLVCLDQLQWCNPQNGLCTAETYPSVLTKLDEWVQIIRNIGLNEYQVALQWRLWKAIFSTTMHDSGIGVIGVSGECQIHTLTMTSRRSSALTA